ncbi:MAG: family 1 glycosylhydrolase [Leptospiraceae bacterium]|nr:family 1 glycosylhydrolase [Leptospiraceae bacterium]
MASTETRSKKTKKSAKKKAAKKSTARSGLRSAGSIAAPAAAKKKTAKKSPASASRPAQWLTAFPKDFLWGTATCATQIDGGDLHSDWAKFSQTPGRIADGKDCLVACDHWNRFEDDYKLMKSLSFNAYRLGVDWSRMEPRPGEMDHAALNHFRGMLDSLRKKSIRPLLTLNHFTLPQWWLERGGWTKESNLENFLNFVSYIVENVGDLVSEYTTINEPNVYAMFSYMDGLWPPAKKGLSGYFQSMKVLRNMAIAQGRMYDIIHETHALKGFARPYVGVAKHVRIFDPARPDNRLDKDRAAEAEYRFNYMWTDSIHDGRLQGSLGKNEKFHDGPCWDFVGLNYYSRDRIRFRASAIAHLFISQEEVKDAPTNDLGWEIYPEGLYRLLHQFHDRYRLPIRITENGIADASDNRREEFLMAHLQQIARALNEGISVEGYYYWSFMDNFEWAEGYGPRFGLVEIDYETQARKVRKSAQSLKKMIAQARKSSR